MMPATIPLSSGRISKITSLLHSRFRTEVCDVSGKLRGERRLHSPRRSHRRGLRRPARPDLGLRRRYPAQVIDVLPSGEVRLKATEDDGLARRREIRRFLMARRGAISPEEVGLPGGQRRRTAGLRREELAALAGVGVTWYTWLEQGRDIRVSPGTLRRIAKALRLTPSDTAYLFSLADLPTNVETGTSGVADRTIRETVSGFRAGPAILVDPSWDVEAYNYLAEIVFEFDAYEGRFARNHIWRFFMDPVRRSKYPDWDDLAPVWPAVLRVAHVKLMGDPYFESLLDALLTSSPEFRTFWERHDTVEPAATPGVRMKLPNYATLEFDSVRFRPVDAPLHLLHVLNPADDHTAEAMRTMSRSPQ